MNYFGHATLAILRKESPAFVLGAMLPDLTEMAGCTLWAADATTDEELKSGVDFHLATDSAFHSTQTFTAMNREVLETFRQAGIRKGPARACAHIGSEILVDAELSLNSTLEKPYKNALHYGVSRPELLGCKNLDDARRLTVLLQHLGSTGVSVHAITKRRVSFRLERALQSRDRLRPAPEELELVAHYLCDLKDVPQRTRALMLELAPLLDKSFSGASRVP